MYCKRIEFAKPFDIKVNICSTVASLACLSVLLKGESYRNFLLVNDLNISTAVQSLQQGGLDHLVSLHQIIKFRVM